jgi:hypothetical protein
MALYNFIKKTTDGGTKVLPIAYKSKIPLIKRWPDTASCDSKQIDQWFKEKLMNAGIPTGTINRFWVLDIDKKNGGFESLKLLEDKYGPIIQLSSYVVDTGGGGIHAFFQLKEGQLIPSLTNLFPGIDVRGEGGQVVSPFSKHESGNVYMPRIDHEDKTLYVDQLKFAPDFLTDLIIHTKKSKPSIAISGIATKKTLKFKKGSRNNDFFKFMSAVRTGPLSNEGLIAAGRAENILRCDPPLGDDEVLRIVKSVYERYQPNIILEPQIEEDAFYGLAGELINEISKHSEASRAALLFQFLILMGNIFGDKFYKPIGGSNIHTNEFCLIIGDTSKARKGTGLKAISFFIKKVWKELFTKRIFNGLSTGEGIIWSLRDPIYETRENKQGEIKTKLVDPGNPFKSAVFIEQEFSKLLKVGNRDTNNVTEVLRAAWDLEILQSLSKTQPAKASNTFISLIGHITSDEFLKCISQVDRFNGFLNRFLFCHSYRDKIISNPINFEVLASHLSSMTDLYCLKSFIDHSNQTEIKLSNEAQTWWDKFYNEYGSSPDGLYPEVKARTENHIIKIAMIYALLDKSYVIEVDHLKAGKAVVSYSNDTIDYIFTKQDKRESNNEKKILEFIKLKGGKVSRTTISYELFFKKAKADQINFYREKLTSLGKIEIANDNNSEYWILDEV